MAIIAIRTPLVERRSVVGHDGVVARVLFVGPTSRSWTSLEAEVNADLERLARPGVELAYRCTGTGQLDIRSAADASQAAPGVVAAVRRAEVDGFNGVIVDCTEDPCVVEAEKLVAIAVVGAGDALERAIAVAAAPIVRVTADDLRSWSSDELAARTAGAATVVLGGTGWSHVVEVQTVNRPGLVVLDPLAVALDACVARLAETAERGAPGVAGRDRRVFTIERIGTRCCVEGDPVVGPWIRNRRSLQHHAAAVQLPRSARWPAFGRRSPAGRARRPGGKDPTGASRLNVDQVDWTIAVASRRA